jgi:hypothetical protein
MSRNWEKKLFSKVGLSSLATLAMLLLLTVGSKLAGGTSLPSPELGCCRTQHLGQ